MKFICAFAALATAAAFFPVSAHDSAVEDMAQAAGHLVSSLSETQRSKLNFPLTDEERFNWHFIPKERRGLPLKELEPAQRVLAHALLQSALSHRGALKAAVIISLEKVLFELENQSPRRDPELYYLSIFGEPRAEKAWGWRFEGHHLSLNFAIGGDGNVVVTPSFFGSNPAEVRSGPRKGVRALGAEEDSAWKLLDSLSAEQKNRAVFATNAPPDIITGNTRRAEMLKPEGLPLSDLNQQQTDLFWLCVREFVFRYRPEIVGRKFDELQKAPREKLYFAWAGSTERGVGRGHYYRVQGPSFLLEYDNTQNNANHIHTVWRDLENDFGEDLLRKHYQQHPHPQK